MSAEIEDLPQKIKKKFIKELAALEYVLVEDKPIGRGAFGFVYKAKAKKGGDLAAFKVIKIPSSLYGEERKLMNKSINQEVNNESR